MANAYVFTRQSAQARKGLHVGAPNENSPISSAPIVTDNLVAPPNIGSVSRHVANFSRLDAVLSVVFARVVVSCGGDASDPAPARLTLVARTVGVDVDRGGDTLMIEGGSPHGPQSARR